MTSSVYITSNSTQVSARWRRIARQVPSALDSGVGELARDALALYQQTTRTWTHQPTFEVQRESTARWRVSTDDEIYGFVDRGTRPHIIEAKNAPLLRFTGPYHAKTKPNIIASYKGGRGRVWVAKKRVNHPGAEARNFSKRIKERIQPRAANKLREKLLEATSGPGVGL